MSPKPILLLLLLLVVTFPIQASQFAIPFEVLVQPKKEFYSLKENLNPNGWKGGFRIEFTVRNISSSVQEFGYWSCSYNKNWATDNGQVAILGWTCKGNFVTKKILKPGESFSGEVPIQIVRAKPGDQVRFKLAFVPYKQNDKTVMRNKPLGTFWSQIINVPVVE